jgi:hypothetical protein
MQGRGAYKWPDGRFYFGDYQLDKKKGQGIYKWTDNRCYLGAWSEGKQHGDGHLALPSGPVKKVVFAYGQRTSMEDETDAEKVEAVRKSLESAEKEVAFVSSNLPNLHMTHCKRHAQKWRDFENEHRLKDRFIHNFETPAAVEEKQPEKVLPAIVEEVASANEQSPVKAAAPEDEEGPSDKKEDSATKQETGQVVEIVG